LFRLEAEVAVVAQGYIEITMGTAVVMTSRFLLGASCGARVTHARRCW